MTNLDLFADLLEEAEKSTVVAESPATVEEVHLPASQSSVTFGQAARQWGEGAIERLAAASDVKTRLKVLRGTEGAYERLVTACLFVAWRKRAAYCRAYSAPEPGWAERLTGWIPRDPELADSVEQLTRVGLAQDELEMLPESLFPGT